MYMLIQIVALNSGCCDYIFHWNAPDTLKTCLWGFALARADQPNYHSALRLVQKVETFGVGELPAHSLLAQNCHCAKHHYHPLTARRKYGLHYGQRNDKQLDNHIHILSSRQRKTKHLLICCHGNNGNNNRKCNTVLKTQLWDADAQVHTHTPTHTRQQGSGTAA